jgi:hypothetical protein
VAATADVGVARRVVTTTPSNGLYLRLAYACAAVGVIGFLPTFWIPLLSGRLQQPSIVYVHAAVFYSWLALFVVQAQLAGSGRVRRHRAWGVFGVSLATAMCFVGTAAALHVIRAGDAAGLGDAARVFSVVPLTNILFFAVVFAIAVLNVSSVDVHRRLMLIATVSLLNAAVGRLFILALGAAPPVPGTPPPPVFVTILPGLIADLLLVPAMWQDYRRLGRVHRVFWIGGAALVASQVLRVPISRMPAWHALADWLARLI